MLSALMTTGNRFSAKRSGTLAAFHDPGGQGDFHFFLRASTLNFARLILKFSAMLESVATEGGTDVFAVDVRHAD